MDENSLPDHPLKIPSTPPRVCMDDPDFDNLTSAEKLNDSKYRSLIYRRYPDEPTCGCKSTISNESPSSIDNQKNSLNLLVCPGGCKNRCCMSSRSKRAGVTVSENNANDDKVARFSPSYCAGNQRNKCAHNSAYCTEERMRGGGGEMENYRHLQQTGQVECPRNLRNAMQNDCNQQLCKCPVSDYYYAARSRSFEDCDEFLPNTLADCFPSSRKQEALSSAGKSREICTMEPCIGVECLERTLRETQNFVDSLGKVPGLAGLGLMDPSESPYFTASLEKRERIPKIPEESTRQSRHSKSSCPSYNPRVKLSLPVTKARPFPMFRDGISPMSHGISIKTDEENKKVDRLDDTETGPCGEFVCKSRWKKNNNRDGFLASMEKLKSLDEKASSRGQRRGKRMDRQRTEMVPGPRGDNSGPQIKRRKSNYVYIAGDSYSGSAYSHKNCADLRKRVPANMGWLWNHYQAWGRLKPRVGWKPGAISRQMREIIRETKAISLAKTGRARSAPSRQRNGRMEPRSYTSLKKVQAKKIETEEEDPVPPPTLNIQRIDGTYYVTMYPIKQEIMDIPKLEVPMKPLQFKIPRYKDDDSATSTSTESDLDINFSTPAAVNRYKKMPNVIHVMTQVKQQEILDAFNPAGEKMLKKKKKKKK